MRPAVKRGERTSGNSTPRGEPPACAGAAGGLSAGAPRSAALARPSGTGATIRGVTPPAGGVTPKGELDCFCTDCGEPTQGTARCEPCAYRSYARSGEHRGMPLYPPRYTVVELATGEDHGTWDSWEEVAMCLAFAKLSREEVEVVTDASPDDDNHRLGVSAGGRPCTCRRPGAVRNQYWTGRGGGASPHV